MVLIPAGTNNGKNLISTIQTPPGVRFESYSGFYPEYYSLTVDEFWMDQTLISNERWEKIRIEAQPYGYADLPKASDNRLDHPVYSISWSDAVKWCNARSEVEGLTPAYYTSPKRKEVYRTGRLDLDDECVFWNAGYRLPTIEEWEYAARGGLKSKRFPWGNMISHGNANYYSDAKFMEEYNLNEPGYHPDGAREKPHTTSVRAIDGGRNAYGLYDMAGNLWQWNWEWHPNEPTEDSRVLRGGSWGMNAGNCKVGFRTRGKPHTRGIYGGFRTLLPKK